MPSYHGFQIQVIKSKNTCKDINKTIFLEFLYLKNLHNALYFFCLFLVFMIFFVLFLRNLAYMQFKIKLYF